MKKILIGVVAIVVFIFLFTAVTEFIANILIQKRISYWKSLIDSELSNGVTKEKMGQWIKKRHLNLSWDNRGYSGDVDEIHYVGNPIPCGTARNIRVDLEVGKIITKYQVEKVGLDWNDVTEKLINNKWAEEASPSEVRLSPRFELTVSKQNFRWAGENGLMILDKLIKKGVLAEDPSGKVYLIRKEGQPIIRPVEMDGIHFNETWGILTCSLEAQKDRIAEIFGADSSKILSILQQSLGSDSKYIGRKIYSIAESCM